MVSWSELFQFCMVILAVIALVLQNNKEKYPSHFPQSHGYFSVIQGEPTYWQHPLCLYYTPICPICQLSPACTAGFFIGQARSFYSRTAAASFFRRFMQTK